MKKFKMEKTVTEIIILMLLNGAFLLFMYLIPPVIGALILIFIVAMTIANLTSTIAEWIVKGRHKNEDFVDKFKMGGYKIDPTFYSVVTLNNEQLITKMEREVYVGSKAFIENEQRCAVDGLKKEIEKYIQINQRLDEHGNLIISASLKVVNEKETFRLEDI